MRSLFFSYFRANFALFAWYFWAIFWVISCLFAWYLSFGVRVGMALFKTGFRVSIQCRSRAWSSSFELHGQFSIKIISTFSHPIVLRWLYTGWFWGLCRVSFMPRFSFMKWVARAPNVLLAINIVHKAIHLRLSIIDHFVWLWIIMALFPLCDFVFIFSNCLNLNRSWLTPTLRRSRRTRRRSKP